jgi:hypothetical protein
VAPFGEEGQGCPCLWRSVVVQETDIGVYIPTLENLLTGVSHALADLPLLQAG